MAAFRYYWQESQALLRSGSSLDFSSHGETQVSAPQSVIQTPRLAGIIPDAVRALLDFHVRGYYKQTIPAAEKTAATHYIIALEKVVDDLKEVVYKLYQERESAARLIQLYAEKWAAADDDPSDDDVKALREAHEEVSKNDPSEYVSGL